MEPGYTPRTEKEGSGEQRQGRNYETRRGRGWRGEDRIVEQPRNERVCARPVWRSPWGLSVIGGGGPQDPLSVVLAGEEQVLPVEFPFLVPE